MKEKIVCALSCAVGVVAAIIGAWISPNGRAFFIPMGIICTILVLYFALYFIIRGHITSSALFCVKCGKSWQPAQVKRTYDHCHDIPHWVCPECGEQHIYVTA